MNISNAISLTAFCRSIVIATSYLNVIEDSQEENLKKTAEKRAKTTFSIHWAMNEIWSLANGNDNWQRIAKWWFIFGNGGVIRIDRQTYTHIYVYQKTPSAALPSWGRGVCRSSQQSVSPINFFSFSLLDFQTFCQHGC